MAVLRLRPLLAVAALALVPYAQSIGSRDQPLKTQEEQKQGKLTINALSEDIKSRFDRIFSDNALLLESVPKAEWGTLKREWDSAIEEFGSKAKAKREELLGSILQAEDLKGLLGEHQLEDLLERFGLPALLNGEHAGLANLDGEENQFAAALGRQANRERVSTLMRAYQKSIVDLKENLKKRLATKDSLQNAAVSARFNKLLDDISSSPVMGANTPPSPRRLGVMSFLEKAKERLKLTTSTAKDSSRIADFENSIEELKAQIAEDVARQLSTRRKPVDPESVEAVLKRVGVEGLMGPANDKLPQQEREVLELAQGKRIQMQRAKIHYERVAGSLKDSLLADQESPLSPRTKQRVEEIYEEGLRGKQGSSLRKLSEDNGSQSGPASASLAGIQRKGPIEIGTPFSVTPGIAEALQNFEEQVSRLMDTTFSNFIKTEQLHGVLTPDALRAAFRKVGLKNNAGGEIALSNLNRITSWNDLGIDQVVAGRLQNIIGLEEFMNKLQGLLPQMNSKLKVLSAELKQRIAAATEKHLGPETEERSLGNWYGQVINRLAPSSILQEHSPVNTDTP
ncbi:putative DNA double-strand break repair rad50 ATPase [Besnoitia besnoiti]|uniref:Putative DNA double-strand break repair rad50 ATPase n=1 Tax=Besnoitia besnoiti TaxID=94643 RepID=A0A2A9M9B3_BESBE|nr:putative DNA double-strand break repair rad50 ATPase [Besnoitia besnoiti]PFH31972.1 putative DNA double-strand break repair rad50 ATPase [Besnoitia besnoiti]